MPCTSTNLSFLLKAPIADIVGDDQSLAEWRTHHVIQLPQWFQDDLLAALPPLPPSFDATNLVESCNTPVTPLSLT
jgi:hypothetical protein